MIYNYVLDGNFVQIGTLKMFMAFLHDIEH